MSKKVVEQGQIKIYLWQNWQKDWKNIDVVNNFMSAQVVMEEEEEEEEVEEKKSPKELEEEKNAEKEAQQKMV